MNLIEIEDHIVCTDYIKNKPTIIDCGACVGNFTKPLYEQFSGTYFLYEPDMRNYRRLQKRLKGLSNIYYYNKAISNMIGKDTFHLGRFITASSLYDTHRGLGNLTTVVDTTTIDMEINKHSLKEVDLVKFDLEGSEIYVIPDMRKDTLSKIKQIVVEYHLQAEINGYKKEDVDNCREFLTSNGFIEIKYVDKGNKGQEACYLNEYWVI